ncbi:MAG: LCP family protein [Coriobacteriales bacterium]|nr:LCP family protein [Coriobacteriales bacterium]
MSAKNPYEGYDEIDTQGYDPDATRQYQYDEDGPGSFSFVDDEYDSMDQGVEEGFAYPNESYAVRSGHTLRRDGMAQSTRQGRGSTQEMPRTQVRPAVEAPPPEPYIKEPRGPILRRRKKRNSDRPRAAYRDNRPYENQPINDGAYAPAPQEQYATRPPRRRRKHHFGCLFTLLVLIGLVVGAYWYVAHPIDDQLAFTPEEQKTVNGTLSWNLPGMPYYVLALGSDAREGEDASRTDTMILVRVDLIGGKLTMVSIPRDTMVEIEGYGRSKINAAYAYGGAGGAVRAVTKLTGVPINHVVVVHFEQLVGLVDYLGGVTVNVPVDVYDPDYTGLVLSSGMQTLDGATALALARTRYGFEDGDYQRQENQRVLFTAIMNRVLSLSPREVPKALEQIGALIGTDMRCYNLVPLFLRFKLANPTVYSCSIPTTSDMLDGYWYEVVDQTAMQKLLQTVNSGGDPAAT